MDRTKLRQYFLFALIVATGLVALFIFLPFATPLVAAAIVAVVLSPVYRYVRARLPGGDTPAALVTSFLALVCLLLPLAVAVAIIGYEAQKFYVSLTSQEGRVVQQAAYAIDAFLSSFTPWADPSIGDVVTHLRTYLAQGLEQVVRYTANFAAGAAQFALSLLLFFIALFYLLRDGEMFRHAAIHLSPLSRDDDELLLGRIERAINSVIKGNLAVALIQGVIASIGLSLFGVPNGVIWGAVTAFAALIPGVGTSLVMIPAAIYTYFATGTLPALGLLAWGMLAVGLVDNFLGPRLIGGGMRLHPLLVLFSVLGGVSLFGFIGIFMGPLTLAFLFALVSVYLERSPDDLTKELGSQSG